MIGTSRVNLFLLEICIFIFKRYIEWRCEFFHISVDPFSKGFVTREANTKSQKLSSFAKW